METRLSRKAWRGVEGPEMRVMFATYWAVILFGIVFYVIVGLADK
jgi:hypothetical protein